MKPKRTILCVDDDERALSIRKVLLETRGYRVLTCSDPDCALEMVKSGGIDLVIADLIMLYVPDLPPRVGIIMTIVALVAAIKFTAWYPDRVKASAAG